MDDLLDESIFSHLSGAEELLRQNLEKSEFHLVNCIRCAAHTLQLVAFDVIKDATMKSNLAVCHKLAVSLRKPTNLSKLKDLRLKLPILDVVTRWNSSYNMIARLVELKDYCYDNSANDIDLDVGNGIWAFMSEFLILFKPIKTATLQLQESQMGFGDFYKVWLRLTIEKNKITMPSVELVKASMKCREKLLLENDVIISAL